MPPGGDAGGRDRGVSDLAADAGDRDATPGPDGSADDGPVDDGGPISPDASLDGYSPPGCPLGLNCQRVVFVTSLPVTYDIALNGDAHCTTLASVALLPRIKGRQFQSWTSTSTFNGEPAARFTHSTASYIRPNGTVIASNS